MKRFLPTLGLGLVLLSGCGSGATDVGELSADQIRDDLLETLNGTHAFDLEFGGESPWSCPGGGEVRPLLQYGYADSPPAIVLEGDLGYEACTGTSTDGHQFTVSGTVTTSLAYPTDPLGQVADGAGTVSGDISWRTATKAGSCHLDLTLVVTSDSIRVSGPACGGGTDRTFR